MNNDLFNEITSHITESLILTKSLVINDPKGVLGLCVMLLLSCYGTAIILLKLKKKLIREE